MRLTVILLIMVLAWAPVAARAAEPAPQSPAATSAVPRIAANAAVYGSLYAVALTLVQATSAAIVSVTPPAALGTALTFGIPAVMVVAMAQLVPLVTENVPGTVLDWMGAATAQAP
jgi:cytochrome b561